ncbi:MAG TPA: YceI family protein [Gemmatimonadales bacterium]|nr:YceI family protein [Gemmatimonadales bacterium]
MRFGLLLSVCLCLAWAGPLSAQDAIPSARLREGRLSFDGRATLGDFTGVTTTVAGEMTGGPGLAAVRGWVEAPVRTLKTGNAKRDQDLNKSMESGRYPTIRFDLGEVRPAGARGDTAEVVLVGVFRIHGVSREVELPARVVLARDEIRLRSDFPMNLEDYRIKGLSKFLGMVKMHPDIMVHVDLAFEPITAGTPAR